MLEGNEHTIGGEVEVRHMEATRCDDWKYRFLSSDKTEANLRRAILLKLHQVGPLIARRLRVSSRLPWILTFLALTLGAMCACTHRPRLTGLYQRTHAEPYRLIFDPEVFVRGASCPAATHNYGPQLLTKGALEVEDACQGDRTCSCPYRRIPRRTAGAPLVAMFAVVGGLTNQMDCVAVSSVLSMHLNLTYGVPQLYARRRFVGVAETEMEVLSFDSVYDGEALQSAADDLGLRLTRQYSLYDFPRHDIPTLVSPSQVGDPDAHLLGPLRAAQAHGHAGVSFHAPVSYLGYYRTRRTYEQMLRDHAYIYAALLPKPELRQRIARIMATLPSRFVAVHVRVEADVSPAFLSSYENIGAQLSALASAPHTSEERHPGYQYISVERNRVVGEEHRGRAAAAAVAESHRLRAAGGDGSMTRKRVEDASGAGRLPVVLLGDDPPDYIRKRILQHNLTIVDLPSRARALKMELLPDIRAMVDMYTALASTVFLGHPVSSFSLHVLARRRYFVEGCPSDYAEWVLRGRVMGADDLLPFAPDGAQAHEEQHGGSGEAHGARSKGAVGGGSPSDPHEDYLDLPFGRLNDYSVGGMVPPSFCAAMREMYGRWLGNE